MDRETLFNDHPCREEVKKPLSVQTIHGYVRTLRAFASWLEEEGYTETNIFKRLKPPRLPETLIKPLTEDEIRSILVSIPRRTPEGVRNYAIVLLFLDAGIRLSELANLKLDDIEFGAGYFKVFGKGARERMVPMGHTTQRAVLRYAEGYRPEPINPNETRLFLTVAGDPMSKNSVGKMVQQLARRSGVPRLHPICFATLSLSATSAARLHLRVESNPQEKFLKFQKLRKLFQARVGLT
jgi:site-specific recombinase XerD